MVSPGLIARNTRASGAEIARKKEKTVSRWSQCPEAQTIFHSVFAWPLETILLDMWLPVLIIALTFWKREKIHYQSSRLHGYEPQAGPVNILAAGCR